MRISKAGAGWVGGIVGGGESTVARMFKAAEKEGLHARSEKLGPGRATGGDVAPNRLYPVNERGLPELLNVSGKQYLMTGNKPGQVEPLTGKGGQANPLVVNITNNAGVDVTPTQNEDGSLDIKIERAAVRGARAGYAMAQADVRSGSGPLSAALKARGVSLDGSNPRRN